MVNSDTSRAPLNTASNSSANSVNFALSNASFAGSSLLLVDARAGMQTDANGQPVAALQAGEVMVQEGAKLLISDITLSNAGKATVHVVQANKIDGIDSNNQAMDVTYWGYDESVAMASKVTAEQIDSSTLLFDSAFIIAEEIEVTAENGFVVQVTQKDSAKVYDRLAPSLASYINKGIADNIQNAGMNFIRNASLETNGDALIEGAVKLGVAGNAMSDSASVSDVSSANVQNRTSFISATDTGKSAGSVLSDGSSLQVVDISAASMQNGFALWLQPMYEHQSSDGFKSGNFKYGYDSDLYGASVGADYTFYGNLRLGAALHFGGGNSESNGDFSKTENDFSYFGGSLYAGYMMGDFGLSADIGYSESSNEVKQKTILGNLNADFNSSVLTVGTRAEYRFDMGDVQIIPHLGFRYNRFNVEDYDTKDSASNEALFHNEVDKANTFAIPIGVAIEGDFTTKSGIKIKPKADIGVQFTMGDLDVKQKVGIQDISGMAVMNNEIFDPVTFVGGVGLSIEKGNFSLGLGYKLNASSNVISHGVHGVLTFKF